MTRDFNAEAVFTEAFTREPEQAIELAYWIVGSTCILARLEYIPMPLSYAEWRELVGYPPGYFEWDGEQVLRAAYYAVQPGCCA